MGDGVGRSPMVCMSHCMAQLARDSHRFRSPCIRRRECELCPSGKFAAQAGSTCTLCPRGTVADDTRVHCKPCVQLTQRSAHCVAIGSTDWPTETGTCNSCSNMPCMDCGHSFRGSRCAGRCIGVKAGWSFPFAGNLSQAPMLGNLTTTSFSAVVLECRGQGC